MNSDKRIINVVGSVGGLKTLNHHYRGRFSKKVKEEKEDFQMERTIIVDKSSPTAPLQVAFITTIAKKLISITLMA